MYAKLFYWVVFCFFSLFAILNYAVSKCILIRYIQIYSVTILHIMWNLIQNFILLLCAFSRVLCAAYWYFYVKVIFILIIDCRQYEIELSAARYAYGILQMRCCRIHIGQKRQYFLWQSGFLKHRTMLLKFIQSSHIWSIYLPVAFTIKEKYIKFIFLATPLASYLDMFAFLLIFYVACTLRTSPQVESACK